MNKCLRIVITAQFSEDFLRLFLQKHAKKLALEGTAQIIDSGKKKVQVVICGACDELDQFVDLIHKGDKGFELMDIEIEPFLKDKDYRTVFRVIE